MQRLLIRWAIAAGALYATIWILHGLGMANLDKGPWYGWFVAVIIMSVINASIKPVASCLTAPLNCMTFGIVGVIVNAVMFALIPFAAAAIGEKVFSFKDIWGPLIGSILVGVIQGLAGMLLIREDEE